MKDDSFEAEEQADPLFFFLSSFFPLANFRLVASLDCANTRTVLYITTNTYRNAPTVKMDDMKGRRQKGETCKLSSILSVRQLKNKQQSSEINKKNKIKKKRDVKVALLFQIES